MFSLEGITGSQREYIGWLLQTCSVDRAQTAEDILTEEAIDLLANRLRTPLQIQQHLTLALEAGYQIGDRPVSAEVVTSVMSRQIDDLEPTLMRHGYRIKDLAEQFDAKPVGDQGAVQERARRRAGSATARADAARRAADLTGTGSTFAGNVSLGPIRSSPAWLIASSFATSVSRGLDSGAANLSWEPR